MDVIVCEVDWKELVVRFHAGTLGGTWEEAMLKDERWIRSVELEDDSRAHFQTVAEAYEQLRRGLSDAVREQADAVFHGLLAAEGYRTDLGNGGGVFPVSLNPETVARLAEEGDALDWEELRNAYDGSCTRKTKGTLADYVGCEADESFDHAFQPYVDMWIDVLAAAAERGRGVVVAWSGE